VVVAAQKLLPAVLGQKTLGSTAPKLPSARRVILALVIYISLTPTLGPDIRRHSIPGRWKLQKTTDIGFTGNQVD
jgi:hypothetical protein